MIILKARPMARPRILISVCNLSRTNILKATLKKLENIPQMFIEKRKCPMNLPNIRATEYIGLKFNNI
jgi:hypothetical protein